MRANALSAVASVVLLATASGCVRAKRFSTLSTVPASVPSKLSDLDSSRSEIAIQNFTSGVASLRVGEKTFRLLQTQSATTQSQPNFLVANVSTSEATSTPVSAYFSSGPEAQAEIIKLFGQFLAKETKPSVAVRSLFDALFDANQRPTTNPYRFRSEITITHGLGTAADWDRVSILMLGLVPHDEEIRIVDTNQLESVIKDLEIGTLTQTSSAEASLAAKRSVSDVFKLDPTTETTAYEIGPSAKGTYTEQLQRKLREQLNLRSSSIEAQGQLFRLTYRTNGVEQIPSMTRQILTFEYKPENRVSGQMIDFDLDSKGEIKKLTRTVIPLYRFKRFTDSADLTATYEIRATPILFGVVRQIKNLKGIRTLAFDDDDDVELVSSLKELPSVLLASMPIRRYVIRLTSGRQISTKELSTDRPATAFFSSELAARRFLEWFRAAAIRSGADMSDGLLLTPKEVEQFGTHRFGILDLTNLSHFSRLSPQELNQLVIDSYRAQ